MHSFLLSQQPFLDPQQHFAAKEWQATISHLAAAASTCWDQDNFGYKLSLFDSVKVQWWQCNIIFWRRNPQVTKV